MNLKDGGPQHNDLLHLLHLLHLLLLLHLVGPRLVDNLVGLVHYKYVIYNRLFNIKHFLGFGIEL